MRCHNYILPFIFIFFLFYFPLFSYSSVEPPEVPKRPTIEELRKSLNEALRKEHNEKKDNDSKEKRKREK